MKRRSFLGGLFGSIAAAVTIKNGLGAKQPSTKKIKSSYERRVYKPDPLEFHTVYGCPGTTTNSAMTTIKFVPIVSESRSAHDYPDAGWVRDVQ